MKNNIVLYFVVVLVIIVFVTLTKLALSSNKQLVCTNKSDQSSNGYVLETKYVIKSKFSKVKTINISESITSKDKKVLDNFEKQLKDNYSYNKKTYGGYKYKITNNNGVVTSNVIINYKKFDIEKFIDNNEAMKKYTKNNKLTLEGAKKMYESTGATCK